MGKRTLPPEQVAQLDQFRANAGADLNEAVAYLLALWPSTERSTALHLTARWMIPRFGPARALDMAMVAVDRLAEHATAQVGELAGRIRKDGAHDDGCSGDGVGGRHHP